ncbi:MAG: hypothetical protein K0R51_834 [Cytophagaceae bacterium]|jgi:hypothetical protein|nr:hypothetical protein [Cytophagaceae bacterium]
MERLWFNNPPFKTLEIHQFKSISSRSVIQSKCLTDTALVQSLTEQIQQIPPHGDMMVSFGPDAEYISLTFRNDIQDEVIEIIQRRFKTPSTGFNSNNALEKELYEKILALLK